MTSRRGFLTAIAGALASGSLLAGKTREISAPGLRLRLAKLDVEQALEQTGLRLRYVNFYADEFDGWIHRFDVLYHFGDVRAASWPAPLRLTPSERRFDPARLPA